ncbi:2-hydroxyacid dehydrogenase [Aquabacter cavernae]|uniref:2-hydroxyacid dehydrogenase n=1 Tax=Aquabacter cavernae TaxID=2496029 RepID=UPI0013E048BB|nr:glyoxylate/hydroxypyruvate reductase A [Aquabacter cavernae]
MILFHSDASDPRWPDAIQRALPDFEMRRTLDGVPPEDVAAAVVWKHPPGLLEPLTNLKLIQVLGAGVDHFLADTRLPKGVPIARLVDPGLTARMSEYVLMHTLALHRRLPESARAQRDGRWDFIHPQPPERTCVGILGLGELGQACAAALSGIGFRVLGWSRSRRSGMAFETYAGEVERSAFLRQCDILVLLLPLTAQTRDIVDARFFDEIRPGAALINVGRGALVDDAALVAALDEDRLRHAVLDVFRQEPLPPEHPFWTHPAITVTPHNSSATNPDTAMAQVTENIRRAVSGQTPLHLVDPAAGY